MRESGRIRSDTAFKYGMSVAYIVVIVLLWFFVYSGFKEYNGTSVETFGIIMVNICAAVGSGAMLFSLYGILKWKPD